MHALVLVAKAKARIWRLTSLIMMVRNSHSSGLYPTNRKPHDEAGQGFWGGFTEKFPLHLLTVLYIPIQLDFLGRIPEQTQLSSIGKGMIQYDNCAHMDDLQSHLTKIHGMWLRD